MTGQADADEYGKLTPRESCPKCSGSVVVESEEPLEEYCIEPGCDYYRAKGGRTGVIRE